MKTNKLKVMSIIGALGLTAGVLTGCASEQEDEYVKVVDSEGQTFYIPEDEFENAGGDGGGMFILFSNWNGSNHGKLKPSKSYSGAKSISKPSSSTSKSGIGKSASTGKSGSGFGG